MIMQTIILNHWLW